MSVKEPLRAKTCTKCNSTGHYHYDEHHAKICEICCLHSQGRWEIPYGTAGHRPGKKTWACSTGCGAMFDSNDGDAKRLDEEILISFPVD